MRNIKIGELKKHISLFDQAHVPLMIYGTFGIGKSDIVRSSAKEKAAKFPNRKYIDWMSSDDATKIDALKIRQNILRSSIFAFPSLSQAISVVSQISSMRKISLAYKQSRGRG